MNYRFLALVSGLVVSAVVATAPVAGQAGATGARPNGSPPKAYAAPRTPDGQPDLQGIWTNATYTPLERPKNVTKEFYTPEEALQLAKRAALEESDQPDLQGVWDFRTVTPLERPAELAGKEVLTAAEAAEVEKQAAVRDDRDRNVPAGNVGDYNQFWYDRGTQVAGTRRTSLIVDPADGRLPPLSAEGQRRAAERAAARKSRGGPHDSVQNEPLSARCILMDRNGPPMLGGAYNNDYQIMQAPGYVMILTEMLHDARIIPLDGRPHLPPNVRQWTGSSRGHWEGQTLVVETTNLTDKFAFQGSSENMRLTERFTLGALVPEPTWPALAIIIHIQRYKRQPGRKRLSNDVVTLWRPMAEVQHPDRRSGRGEASRRGSREKEIPEIRRDFQCA